MLSGGGINASAQRVALVNQLSLRRRRTSLCLLGSVRSPCAFGHRLRPRERRLSTRVILLRAGNALLLGVGWNRRRAARELCELTMIRLIGALQLLELSAK